MTVSTLDPLDLRIVQELQEDGRRPFREIARTLSAPEATIRVRVKKLQDQGILQILAFTNPAKLGPAQLALLFLAVDPRAHDQVVDILTNWPEVSYLSTIIGPTDLCAQVLCRDDEALWLLRQRMREIPGVREVQTMQEIKVHKIRFTIPPVAAGG